MAVAQSTHEYPGPQVGQTASVKAADPVSAVEAFATAYINWDAGTVAHDMGTLAAESVGQARSAMQLAAVQTGRDYELARAGVANRGIVEAIAPVTARSDQYAVVTLERTTATNSTAWRSDWSRFSFRSQNQSPDCSHEGGWKCGHQGWHQVGNAMGNS